MANVPAPMTEALTFDRSSTKLEISGVYGWKATTSFTREVLLTHAEYALLQSIDGNDEALISFIARQHHVQQHQAECIYLAIRADL
jgi:hypothetical protein